MKRNSLNKRMAREKKGVFCGKPSPRLVYGNKEGYRREKEKSIPFEKRGRSSDQAKKEGVPTKSLPRKKSEKRKLLMTARKQSAPKQGQRVLFTKRKGGRPGKFSWKWKRAMRQKKKKHRGGSEGAPLKKDKRAAKHLFKKTAQERVASEKGGESGHRTPGDERGIKGKKEKVPGTFGGKKGGGGAPRTRHEKKPPERPRQQKGKKKGKNSLRKKKSPLLNTKQLMIKGKKKGRGDPMRPRTEPLCSKNDTTGVRGEGGKEKKFFRGSAGGGNMDRRGEPARLHANVQKGATGRQFLKNSSKNSKSVL